MRAALHKSSESGIVLLTTLLILMMISALMVGFYAAVNSDVRAGAIDRDQTQAYAAAHAGLEKLTSDLAQLFQADVSPTSQQILDLADTPPDIPGFEYRAPGGAAGSGYSLVFSKTDVNGNPAPEDVNGSNITAGPYKGLKGIITKYPITITARSITGNAEVRLRRELQTVAVPVFQFGIFSDTDLSMFAGGDFSFGGRVHTNGSLFVCHQTNSGTMTFSDRITAAVDVVRKHWSNGLLNANTSPSCTNNVLIPRSPSTNRNLRQSPNEGSVAGMPGSTVNSSWKNLSQNIYKGYIRNGATGATRLDLPLVSEGAMPIDLIRRPLVNSDEDTTNATVYAQRYFGQASLRILLSDRVADIMDLPTVTTDAPVLLDGDWGGAGLPTGYGPVDGTHPPIARLRGDLPAVSTKSSSCCSSGNIQTQTAIPAAYLPATVTIGGNLNPCTGKNATQFIGCTFAINPVAGSPVVVTMPSGMIVSTTTSGAVGGTGTAKTVTINTPTGVGVYATSNFRTAPFSVHTFFINGELYTCTGYDSTTRFTGCNTNTTPPNNRAITMGARADENQGTIGGYIKIEKQASDGTWDDVTMEILNLGIGAPNQQGFICADPTPNAILRIQRLRDHGWGTDCPHAASTVSWDWWPQTLYDAREGSTRTLISTDPMTMGGIMQYIALDVGNLKKWLEGTTGTTGTTALNTGNNNGYIVYFSDRRGNHDAANSNVETGEFGYEDQVNSTTAAGTPDGVMQTGEDLNGNTTQEVYGKVPANIVQDLANGIAGVISAGAQAPYDSSNNSRPWITMPNIDKGQARVNKVVLFRRALKVVNGGIDTDGGTNNLPSPGLTITTENPVYVQGNYNATTSNTLAEPNMPSAIVADAVTLLSRAWTDANSFANPHAAMSRGAAETGWRFAAVGGKGLSFPHCGSACGDPGDLYGTDGGAANFLRLLENWNGAGGLNYRGSIVSLHVNRQAVGIYKFPAAHTYNGGERNFFFDAEFLTPSLLPPGTPMFRDINTLTFRQILRPTQ